MKIGDFTFLNKEYHLVDILVEIYKYWIDDMAMISIIQQHIHVYVILSVSLNQVGVMMATSKLQQGDIKQTGYVLRISNITFWSALL